ncbi:hypothetical protein CspeluHIS016_0600590 [Cutaneotrichosporon spelunceum]|uniref:MARVEL domain-containing protein n=1 Tax=Cutaneotrichosporon spelunceum TaxID=1672016 RepID=A0AAD3TYA2_9TREE|nr:hypothetical protein CspeluHIS016_0600590 [Cutaneotrichosporon spelunceum]
MRAHSVQALSHTLILLLALAGAVAHGVYLAAVMDLAEPGREAIASGALLGWLVVLALYLVSTMLVPKNSRYISTLTDVLVLLLFAATGAAGTVYLATIQWGGLDRCHRRLGKACEASLAGGVIGAVVVVALIVSAITEAVYVTKHHGKEGWFLSLRWLGHNTSKVMTRNTETLRPLILNQSEPSMAQRQPRQPRQGIFVPLAIRRSNDYDDLALVSPLRVTNRTSKDSVRSARVSSDTSRFSTDTVRATSRPHALRGHKRSGSGGSGSSLASLAKGRTPSVFSNSSRTKKYSEVGPLLDGEVEDPFARARRMSDGVEELDEASIRSARIVRPGQH